MKPDIIKSPPPVRMMHAGILAVILILVVLSSVTAFILVRGVTFPWGGKLRNNITQSGQSPSGGSNAQGTPLPGNPGSTGSMPTLTPWDGAGRVTMLLMGLDYRDWQADEGPSRTDTMILLTLDPLTHTAGILSIPRDLWVAIPGFKHGKINTAYYLGEAYQLPGGGPGLAVKTVEEFLGVPINYYAQIDFSAFVRFIDEIGGVKVDVPEKITVDLLGTGSSTKKTLKPGVQVLPGEWALAYARARYTEGGDFDRAQRQQQVIMGIRERVLSVNMLPVLISRAPALYNELAAGVHTNMTLDEAIRLAALAQQIPQESIKRGAINQDCTLFGWSPDKLSILIPIPDKIHTLRDEIFTTSGSLGPLTPGNLSEQVQTENARLRILNGSSTGDLLERVTSSLRAQGVNVADTGSASQAYASTRIIDHTGNPYLLKYLVGIFQITSANIQIDFVPDSPVDIELILGNDAANQQLP